MHRPLFARIQLQSPSGLLSRTQRLRCLYNPSAVLEDGLSQAHLAINDLLSEPLIQPRVNVWWSEFDHIDICTGKLCSQNYIEGVRTSLR